MGRRDFTFRKKTGLFTTQAAALAFLAGTQAARAQDTAPAAAGAAPADDAIAEVIVTATKRATSLQDTPVAVTALDAQALADAHVQTVQDVVHLVPSFQATTQGDHGVITMTMRGIGNDSAKTEYADPEVAIFVDGIYSPRAEGATSLLFDMGAIEVLRGPQGTLWGRNSTVGAVNMQTAKPVLGQTSASLEGGIGDYARFGARGALNLPLADTLAVRLAFVHEQHDGYVDYQAPKLPSLAEQQAAYAASGGTKPFEPINPNLFVQGGDKYNAQNQSALRVSALWQPLDRLSWTLSYEYFVDRGTPNMNLMQTPRAGQDRWSALIDTAPYVDRDVTTLRSRVDYTISDYLEFAYIAGFSRYSGQSTFDQDGGALAPTSFASGATFQEDRTNWSTYKNQSHELQLQSRGRHTVDWILGLYYAAEDNGIRFDIPIFNGTQQGTVSWQGSFIQPKETVDSKAVFGQATWNLTDALHLTGGLRYTADDRKNEGGTNNGWDPANNPPALGEVPIDPSTDPRAPGSGFTTYQHNDGHYSGNKLTWLTRVSYDFSKDFLGYASVSTGYKSGGLQDGGREYGPEELTNYELGIKNTFFGGKLTWNNAVYYEDFTDFQFSAPVTNPDGTHSLATSNAEGAKVWGIESELAARITRDDRVQLSMAYTHTQLGELIAGSNDYALPAPCVDRHGNPVAGVSSCLDVTDNELPHAPSFAAQLMYEHKFHLGNGAVLAPRVAVHYETASWLSVFNLGEGDRQDAYTRTDLALRYTTAAQQPWYVDVYVRNVEDDDVKTSAQNAFGVWQAQYLPPRTFGANFGIEF
ncbi:TonB-dependent receptor [Solimonas flava]|uniref:TonB-dependent receptor n=1 Tax=Solimonas flava TaxID=415849 RepID=UPI0004092FB0|nr:TonB-dependent receptor [Solimonas flava]